MAETIAVRIGTGPKDLRALVIAGAITLAINTALQAWAEQPGERDVAPFVYEALQLLASPLLPE
jgi:hypothetical protein